MKQVTNLQEIETAIDENGEIVLSKNNKNNVIVMSIEEYYKNYLKKEMIKFLKQSEKEIENGEGIKSDEVFKALKKKYGY